MKPCNFWKVNMNFFENKHQLQREANSIPKLKLLDQLMNEFSMLTLATHL